LKKFHNDLLDSLKKFSQDRTFTQDPRNSWSNNHEPFYSLDLSAATDRFPVFLQMKVLSLLYDNNFPLAWTWKQILTNREFYSPLYGKHHYNVGQPMGSYSS
jgi:hypothetical protein